MPFAYYKRVVISIDTLKSDRYLSHLRKQHWDAVVIDESHNVTGASQISISDIATIRGRAGYAMGCFLPYAFVGLALGNADIGQSVGIQEYVAPAYLGPYTAIAPLSSNNIQHNHLIYGYSAGLGVDVNLVG